VLPLRPAAAAALLWLACAAASAGAADAPAADPELEQMRDRLATRLPEVRRDDIVRSAAPGLFEVRAEHTIGYVTADGRFLLSGSLVDIDSGERITERRLNEDRLQTVRQLEPGAIVFAPMLPSSWITVFTDVDCEYCRLLHREVPKLNAQGIGVRYLFFSKYGSPSKAFDRARVVWCQNDQRSSLDVGLSSGIVPSRKPGCDNDPVQRHYQAAADLGIRGTPATILPDGSLYYGYAKAETLIEEIRKRNAEAAKFSGQPNTAP